MLHIRLVFTMLMVLCFGVLTTSNAFAIKKGELVNKEGKALIKTGATVKIGASVSETVTGLKITCKEGSGSGKVIGTKGAEASLTLSGCESDGQTCHTGEGKESQIDLGPTEISWLIPDKGDHVLSSFLLKEVIIHCSSLELKVKGGFLIPIGSAQEEHLKSEFTLSAEQKEGKQIPTEFENTKKEIERFTLESNFGGEGFVQSGTSATVTIKLEEEAEMI